MKNKIATVLKITKTKIKQSYELRKFHTSRGENEQLQKTSGAYVLSSRKKNQKSLMGGGWQPPPLYIRGLKRVTKINHCRKGQDEPSHATPCLLGICRWHVRTTNLLVGSNTISRSMICAGWENECVRKATQTVQWLPTDYQGRSCLQVIETGLNKILDSNELM